MKGDDCVAFTAVSHSDKAIIISFRGSTLNEVVVEVLEALLDKPVVPFVGGGYVLSYFLDAFHLLWNNGVKDDFLTLKNANPGYEIWVTGHSLGLLYRDSGAKGLIINLSNKELLSGAALASLGAATIAHTNLYPADQIKLVTFGQPRVGDKGYAAAVDSTIAYAYRVVHKNDIVPQLPPQFLKGYHHHKSEVWYDNSMNVGATFTECDVDEGAQCSDSQLDLNIAVSCFEMES